MTPLDDILCAPPTSSTLRRKGSRFRDAHHGMFIIDQFEVTESDGSKRQTEDEIIGGGGVYAMMGARLFLPSQQVGIVVDKGDDFPPAFEKQLSVLGEGVYWRKRQGGTTRALNIYSGGEIGEGHQSFQYLTSSLQIHLTDLVRSPSPFNPSPPEWVHVVVRHPRASDIIAERNAIAQGEVDGVERSWKPKMIWEPLDVQGGQRLEMEEWCRLAVNFEVVSPNLLELQYILHITADIDSANTPIKTQTENAAGILLSHLRRAALSLGTEIPVIVIRVGKEGCYTLSEQWKGWTPAYWIQMNQGRVVDPTGGGNGFLGGFGAGMILSDGDVRAATIFGSAAASFMIQQRGMPVYEGEGNGVGGNEGGRGRWNGDEPWDRVREIAERMEDQVGPSGRLAKP